MPGKEGKKEGSWKGGIFICCPAIEAAGGRRGSLNVAADSRIGFGAQQLEAHIPGIYWNPGRLPRRNNSMGCHTMPCHCYDVISPRFASQHFQSLIRFPGSPG